MRNSELHPGLGHYDEMEPYYRMLPEREILSSPVLIQAMSMLDAMCMDYEGSELVRGAERLRFQPAPLGHGGA